jgi:DMSO/TMAO reductase YedYZ molybdopterin-dependent catalytic subunit
MKTIRFYHIILGMVIIVTAQFGCSRLSEPVGINTLDSTSLLPYPGFITANKDCFTTRIGDIPNVNADSIRLEITGLVDTPRSFSLRELMALPLVTMPLTIE